MKILMFGWEFPPYVSGGLGTACQGMVKGLAQLGHDIIFVMPGPAIPQTDTRIKVVSTEKADPADTSDAATDLERILIKAVASPLRPYINDSQYLALRSTYPPESYLATSGGYGRDLMAEVLRYGRAGGEIAGQERFDVIHGHDWMSVYACLEAKKVSGKPFVFHVHALEFDRSGEKVNQSIYNIERYGMEMADAVIAVSHRTKNISCSRYGISSDKIAVVHNAVTRKEDQGMRRMEKKDLRKGCPVSRAHYLSERAGLFYRSGTQGAQGTTRSDLCHGGIGGHDAPDDRKGGGTRDRQPVSFYGILA